MPVYQVGQRDDAHLLSGHVLRLGGGVEMGLSHLAQGTTDRVFRHVKGGFAGSRPDGAAVGNRPLVILGSGSGQGGMGCR